MTIQDDDNDTHHHAYCIVGYIFLQVHIFADLPMEPPAEIFVVLIFMHGQHLTTFNLCGCTSSGLQCSSFAIELLKRR